MDRQLAYFISVVVGKNITTCKDTDCRWKMFLNLKWNDNIFY